MSSKVETDSLIINNTRYHYLDNLRAFAMLAGVVLHAMLAYGYVYHDAWPSADTATSIFIDYFCFWLHTFRMPLFFLIAGFFAHYLYERRGIKGFIKNRAVRLALPFFVFWPIMAGSLFGLIIYVALQVPEVDTPMIQLVRKAIADPESMNGQKPPVSTTHLWFIYYLFMFCLLTLALTKLCNGLNFLKEKIITPTTLFIVMPLITFFAIITKFIPHPAPESFIPELWALIFYGAFYFVGWFFYTHQNLLQLIDRYKTLIWITAALNTSLFIYVFPERIPFEELIKLAGEIPSIDANQIAKAFSTSLMAWSFSLLFLHYAHSFLNNHNRALRFISNSSYWIYIIHVPIIMALQFWLHTVDWGIAIELSLSLTLTLLVGSLSYMLIRVTPIGWMLNGRKHWLKP